MPNPKPIASRNSPAGYQVSRALRGRARTLLPAAVLLLAAPSGALADSGTTNAMDALMVRFYTDASMTTMRGREDFMAAYNSMSSQDRNVILEACRNVSTMRATFCDTFNAAHNGTL